MQTVQYPDEIIVSLCTLDLHHRNYVMVEDKQSDEETTLKITVLAKGRDDKGCTALSKRKM